MTAGGVRKLLVGGVAAHSCALGMLLLASPAWMLELAGWQYGGPAFFPRQSGVFLLIVGGAYLVGLWQRPFAEFLVATKAVAVLFLLTEYVFGEAPTAALVAALLDGAMGLSVALALAWERQRRRQVTQRPDRGPANPPPSA